MAPRRRPSSLLASYGGPSPTVTSSGARGRARAPLAFARAVVDAVFADTCVGCRERPAGRRLGLCTLCRGRLEAHASTRCSGCARPLPGSFGRTGRCGACLAEPPPWRRLFTLYSYRAPFDRVIHAFKFQGLESLGTELAEIAFDRFAEELLLVADREIGAVVPMPLPWTRRLRRGFNQAEAIAAPLAARLGVPLYRALERRPSPPQSLLPFRRRAVNLRRSLHASKRLPAAPVLLVDDVVTTGATLRAATAVLLRAGAGDVLAFAAGWTPPRLQ